MSAFDETHAVDGKDKHMEKDKDKYKYTEAKTNEYKDENIITKDMRYPNAPSYVHTAAP